MYILHWKTSHNNTCGIKGPWKTMEEAQAASVEWALEHLLHRNDENKVHAWRARGDSIMWCGVGVYLPAELEIHTLDSD